MARQKTGFAFYQVDCDRYQDRRIRKLLRKFRGGGGIAVYDCILCELYRDCGHSLPWDEDTIFDISEILGVTEKTVGEVVKACADIGLFDGEMLKKGIITSVSIQERYKDMCDRAKRKTSIPIEICLIADSSEKCGHSSEKYPHSSEKCTENSEKSPHIIVKNSIVENNSPTQSVCENKAHTHAHAFTAEDSFKSFLQWSKKDAPLSLEFEYPLTLECFVELHTKYGSKKVKACASDIHNKKAYRTNCDANNTFRQWIEKVHLPASEEAKIYRRNA